MIILIFIIIAILSIASTIAFFVAKFIDREDDINLRLALVPFCIFTYCAFFLYKAVNCVPYKVDEINVQIIDNAAFVDNINLNERYGRNFNEDDKIYRKYVKSSILFIPCEYDYISLKNE